MKISSLLLIPAVLVTLMLTPATAREPIEVGAYLYPPASYIDHDGKLSGVTVTLMDATLRQMGYNPKFRVMPFKRCLEFMREGMIPIMLPCVINDERLEYMRYSIDMYYIDSVLWKRGTDHKNCWQKFEDLRGLSIGATIGYAYGPEWDKAVDSGIFSVDYVGGQSPELTHFNKLLADRYDMFICERQLGDFIKEQNSPVFNNLSPCPKSVGPVRSFNAPISRKYFESFDLDPDDFLERFNATFKEVQKSLGD